VRRRAILREGVADDFDDLFGGAIGFGKALGGAGFPGLLDHIGEVGIGEDDDGQVLELLLGADFFHQVNAGDLGHHQIEHNGVRAEGVDGFVTGLAIRGDFDLVAFDGELVAIDIRNNLVVLDDQDFAHSTL
jgi:hypothetical protein